MLSLQTILFPTDDSPRAEAARPLAERLAHRTGATLHVLRVEVVPPVADLRFDPVPRPPEETAAGVLQVHRRFPTAGGAIALYAEEAAADLIVMGTHGRTGVDRLTLGSTAERVLRQAPCPVLTVGPEATAYAEGPVLAPLAFDSASDLVLETAGALAQDAGVPLVAVHAVEPSTLPLPYTMTLPPFDPAELIERVEATLGRWTAPVAERVPVTVDTRVGPPTAQVVEAAREHGAGLVVQASHGRRGLSRWLLGSVAEGVVRHAPCPVLTLRIGARGLPVGQESDLRPVPRDEWAGLFDALSARAEATPHTVSLAVVSPDAEGPVYDAAPLVGVTYDPHDDAVEVLVEGGGHHALRPFAVRAEAGAWAPDAARDAEAPGPWALEVVRADGARERLVLAERAPEARAVPA